MAEHEPQITQIAGFFAARLPTGRLTEERAKETWRRTLRKARADGSIDDLVGVITQHGPEDETLKSACEEVSQR